jgi:zinc protease
MTRNELVAELMNKTLELLKKFKAGPISPEEVKMAKEYLSGSFPLSTSTLESISIRWLAGYLYGLGPTYLNEYVPKLQSVSREQVEAAVKRGFDLDHLSIVIAGNAKEIQKAFSPSQWKSIKRVSVSDLK